jgi:glycolate oxidase FAD binding subunit
VTPAGDGARELAANAILGVAPREVFEPRSREECAAIFERASVEGSALAVVGGRTELGLGAPPERLDAVVSTVRLDRILEHSPSDQVVVVEAGARLAALQKVLAASGQRLSCDAPLGERATIGGLLATNGFGPLRTRYGALRDLVIGMSIVRADGAVVRGGGKVVKNVAGFDLPKLMVGALGTLGMIETAAFRLHPLPEDECTVLVRGCNPDTLRALVVGLRAEQLEPCAFVALGDDGGFDALIRFEGFAAGLRDARDETLELASGAWSDADGLSPEDARVAWAEHDDLRTRGDVRVKLSAAPSALYTVEKDVARPIARVLRDGRSVWYPTLGIAFVTGDCSDARALQSAVAIARERLAPLGGSLVIHEAPVAAREGPSGVDVWGPPPPALALMRRLKQRFDPDARLNAGRFVGGI